MSETLLESVRQLRVGTSLKPLARAGWDREQARAQARARAQAQAQAAKITMTVDEFEALRAVRAGRKEPAAVRNPTSSPRKSLITLPKVISSLLTSPPFGNLIRLFLGEPDQADAAPLTLLSLSADEHRSIFTLLCNVLEPRVAVAFSSTSQELRALTQALLPQLRAGHEAAAALCLKKHYVGLVRSCKDLREAKEVNWQCKGLTESDLTTLGTLGSVLPALETLWLVEHSAHAAGPDGVQRLAEGLGAGALPAVTVLAIENMHVGEAGASALAAALGQGALLRLKTLKLYNAAIGDAGLVALAPALRRLLALELLNLDKNPLGDEGLAALVAPPPPAGVPPLPTGGLMQLKTLNLNNTQVTDTGCATLAAALDSGALPALETPNLDYCPASAVAKAAVHERVT